MEPREVPNYMKVFRDTMDAMQGMPRTQQNKAIGAMLRYFFYCEEPERLPKTARLVFESQRQRLDSYRRSALNGRMANQARIDPKSEPKRELQTIGIAGDLSKVGTTQTQTQDIAHPLRDGAKGGPNNNKEETVNSIGTGNDEARETRAYHRVRPYPENEYEVCLYAEKACPDLEFRHCVWFFNQNQRNGWRYEDGTEIADWQAALRGLADKVRRDAEGEP